MKTKRCHITDGKFNSLLKTALRETNVGAVIERNKEKSPRTRATKQKITDESDLDVNEQCAMTTKEDEIALIAQRVSERVMEHLHESEQDLTFFERGLLGKNVIIATQTLPYIQEYVNIKDVYIWHSDDENLDGYCRIDDPKGMGIAINPHHVKQLINEGVVDEEDETIVLYTDPAEREKSLLLIASLLSKKTQR